MLRVGAVIVAEYEGWWGEVFCDGFKPPGLLAKKKGYGDNRNPCGFAWLGDRDSNPDRQSQSLQSYH